jgi:hypothetical protein
MCPCIESVFYYISNKMQRYTVYLYLETALHVSGGNSTHHQEHINCIYSIWYLSHRYCYLPLAMGPCIESVFYYISNKMQRYTVYLYLETALHVSGGTSTHHQEPINCIYSTWYLSDRYCYLPLAAGSSNGLTNTRCCRYSLWAPDDGWWYHSKHVEQFPDINKLCNVASCWIYIEILLRCTDP